MTVKVLPACFTRCHFPCNLAIVDLHFEQIGLFVDSGEPDRAFSGADDRKKNGKDERSK